MGLKGEKMRQGSESRSGKSSFDTSYFLGSTVTQLFHSEKNILGT